MDFVFWIKEMGKHGNFFLLLKRRDRLLDFMFAFLSTKHLEKGFTMKWKNLLTKDRSLSYLSISQLTREAKQEQSCQQAILE